MWVLESIRLAEEQDVPDVHPTRSVVARVSRIAAFLNPPPFSFSDSCSTCTSQSRNKALQAFTTRMNSPLNITFQYQGWPTSVWLPLSISIITLLVRTFTRPSLPKSIPPRIKDELPILGALRFFSARADFCEENSVQSKNGNYSFHIGPYPVVGLSGLEGRKAFYESKELSLFEG